MSSMTYAIPRSVLTGALVVSTAAFGASAKLTVVSTGDCRDHTMLTNAEALSKEVDGQLPSGFLTQQQAREKLGAEATLSPAEISRQYTAGTELAYEYRLEDSEKHIRAALEQAKRLPPGPDRQKLVLEGESLLAFILGPMNRNDDADEAFRRILRMAPSFKITEELFPPSSMKHFERLRREVTRGSTAKLTVKSSPAGAEVFVDGFLVGKTPFTGKYFPGEYTVEVRKDQLASLRHKVKVEKEAAEVIDLSFEGAIHPNRLPCVSSADPVSGLSYATKLGTVLGVESVAVVRVSRSAGEAWLSATVLEIPSGQKLREGALKITDPTQPPEGLTQLATFVLTGKSQAQVVAGPPPTPVAAVKPVARGALVSPFAGRTWKSTVAYGLGGAGLLVAGAGVYFTSQFVQYDGILQNRLATGTLDRIPAVYSEQEARITNGNLAAVSFVTAAAALGAGAFLFLTDEPQTPGTPKVMVGPGAVRVTVPFP